MYEQDYIYGEEHGEVSKNLSSLVTFSSRKLV